MIHGMFSVLSFLIIGLSAQVVTAVPYAEYILAPPGRTLSPVSIRFANGTVTNARGVTTTGYGMTTLRQNSSITFDYEKNIGGLVSFDVSDVTGSDSYVGISFTESSLWISPWGCDATQSSGIDETIWIQIDGPGKYTVSTNNQRGGFRYLNVMYTTSSHGSVSLRSVTTEFTAMASYADGELRDYTGYFHCTDEGLNRAWYAAAYTCQLCNIPSDKGSAAGYLLPNGQTNVWWANSTLTNGTSVLVDGAKRDKAIWPGDMSISVPGVFLTVNDQITLKLSVGQLLAQQNPTTGQLPYVAAPLGDATPGTYSFTYHMYSLVALYNYFTYSGDMEFLNTNWYRFQFGLNYSLEAVQSSGLAYVPANATADWLRVGMGAYNIEANSILAYVLRCGLSLAKTLKDEAPVTRWQTYYDGIVTAANNLLWDESAGLYNDNQTTALRPQDGNSWAIISGVANGQKSARISNELRARWGPYGAPAPEAGTTVSPFISGLELQAHFLAGQPQNGIDLMKRMWVDFMLDDPRMTNSSFIEGYDVSGALHYPAYSDDARISHAHAWSSGPLIALTNFAAGLHVVSPGSWLVYPQPGSLTDIDAGFQTAIGSFSSNWSSRKNGINYEFETPPSTEGSILMDIPDQASFIEITGLGGWHWSRELGPYDGTARNGISIWGMQPDTGINDGILRVANVPGGKYKVIIRYL